MIHQVSSDTASVLRENNNNDNNINKEKGLRAFSPCSLRAEELFLFNASLETLGKLEHGYAALAARKDKTQRGHSASAFLLLCCPLPTRSTSSSITLSPSEV